MISKEMAKMLNEQMHMELYSGYIYFEISNYYAEAALDGFSHWFFMQAKEEFSHAMRIRTYLLDNDQKLVLKKMDDPSQKYTDFAQPLKAALDHEKQITASINKIYDAAVAEKDYLTTGFLNWFVEEQLEEEVSTSALVDKFEMFNKSGAALYILDKELGGRE